MPLHLPDRAQPSPQRLRLDLRGATGFPGYSSHIPPENGYHLAKDLADKAISFIRDSKQSEPDKPWYLWFCPGADHAPHHAP
jgi:arylsulfatase A-like enzyme